MWIAAILLAPKFRLQCAVGHDCLGAFLKPRNVVVVLPIPRLVVSAVCLQRDHIHCPYQGWQPYQCAYWLVSSWFFVEVCIGAQVLHEVLVAVEVCLLRDSYCPY